jgi:hypothetical protein
MPSNTSKHELKKKLSTFVGLFCPPGSGPTDLIESGSATLVQEQIYGPLIFEFRWVAADLRQCLSACGSYVLNGCRSLEVNLY